MSSAIDNLLGELSLEEDLRVGDGLCACGCGERITTIRGRRYVSERHRNRRHAERVKRVAELTHETPRHSLKTLRASGTTGERRADAPARRNAPQARRKGVSLYLPTLEHADTLLEAIAGLRAAPPAAEQNGHLPVICDRLEQAIARTRARLSQPQRPQEDHARPA